MRSIKRWNYRGEIKALLPQKNAWIRKVKMSLTERFSRI